SPQGRGPAGRRARMSGGPSNFIAPRTPAKAGDLGIPRLAVAARASQRDRTLHDRRERKIAVNGAVTNVVVHAYPAGPGLLTLEAEIGEQGLTVTVSDEGIGIADIGQARQAAYSSDPERMGMGFTFMETFMDDLQVVSTPGEGTTV